MIGFPLRVVPVRSWQVVDTAAPAEPLRCVWLRPHAARKRLGGAHRRDLRVRRGRRAQLRAVALDRRRENFRPAQCRRRCVQQHMAVFTISCSNNMSCIPNGCEHDAWYAFRCLCGCAPVCFTLWCRSTAAEISQISPASRHRSLQSRGEHCYCILPIPAAAIRFRCRAADEQAPCFRGGSQAVGGRALSSSTPRPSGRCFTI